MIVIDGHSQDLGEEYIDALKLVLSIRSERRLQYGDSFMEDEMLFLRFQIKNKLKRFDLQTEIVKEKLDISVNEENKEKALDSLVDLVNYTLFLIAKLNKNEK